MELRCECFDLYSPFGKTLNVNAEYYYTDFLQQVVVDMDSNPHEVAFTIWMGVLIRMYSR